MVLLHGVGLDHTVWEPAAERLSDRFDLVTPDLVGHGHRRPAPAGIGLADLANDVMEHVPRGAHLVGFSLGGLVAEYVAIHHPELVATLVAVSSVCKRTPAEREAVLSRLDVAQSDFSATVAASLDRWFAGTQIDPVWTARIETTLRGNDVDSFLNCYRVVATADAQLGPDLGRIQAPTLAITGDRDPGSTPEMSDRLAAAVPDGRAVIVPGARHMLPIENPDALCNSIANFIEGYAHV
jgi:pimeloyl-ACP methyl ester carboxylesterase